jgi:hypothetical protein
MNEPHDLAGEVVGRVLREGTKTHNGEAWRDEPQDKHLDKAVRHIMTHKLIRDGHQASDGENHLEFALARIAMALAQEGA